MLWHHALWASVQLATLELSVLAPRSGNASAATNNLSAATNMRPPSPTRPVPRVVRAVIQSKEKRGKTKPPPGAIVLVAGAYESQDECCPGNTVRFQLYASLCQGGDDIFALHNPCDHAQLVFDNGTVCIGIAAGDAVFRNDNVIAHFFSHDHIACHPQIG